MSDIQDEVIAAVRDFRSRLPRATKQQAEEEADRVFSESSDQRAFLARWQKEEEAAAKIRQAEFKSSVDRNWPESK